MLAGNISLWGSMKDARYVTISEKCTLPESRKRKRGTGGLTMTLTEMFTICDSCVYAPCLCGNDPENCVAYVMRTSCGAKMDGGADDAAG
jgi:hypothetical protein